MPIEGTVGAMAELVRGSKVGFLGLTEASAATIECACRGHPIAGSKRRCYLHPNIAAQEVVLSAEELGELDRAFPPDAAAGLRYPEAFLG